jgi:hypothetical protein
MWQVARQVLYVGFIPGRFSALKVEVIRSSETSVHKGLYGAISKWMATFEYSLHNIFNMQCRDYWNKIKILNTFVASIVRRMT